MNHPHVPQHGPPGDVSRRLNLPNFLCAVRLAGSLALVAVALTGEPLVVLLVFLLLADTDWIDGKLAVWLNQQSTFGARFDSVADAAMYAAMLFSCVWLQGDSLLGESGWIGIAVTSYLLSCTVALIKFGRLPSYHTYSAKLAANLTVISSVPLLAGGPIWPLRLAMTAVTLANAEALLISHLSHQWQADVRTVWHAIRQPHSRDGIEKHHLDDTQI